jgi:phosphoglycerate kinase
MNIKKIQDAFPDNKKVLLRADFNVAIKNGKIKEVFKVKAVKETLDYLLEKKCRVALLSHFGRPEEKNNPEFSLEQIKGEIENTLDVKIIFIRDCLSEEIKEKIENLSGREVLLLENVRFYAEEEKNDRNFAQKLAEKFEIFINDAFSASHRNQASVTGITEFLPSFAGLKLQKEISEMEKIKNDFVRPATAIIGGAKIETKLPVIKFFEDKYDQILVGGKIANEAIDQKIEFSEKVILPVDFIDNRLDIGNETIANFTAVIEKSKTIIWNGPLGKFEDEKYVAGTQKIFEAVIASGAYTVVGGGETLEILEKNKALNRINFVSTGGGAMLEYLSGNKLPGIEVLRV